VHYPNPCPYTTRLRSEYDINHKIELGSYLYVSENGPLLNKWIEENVRKAKNVPTTTIDLMVYINQRLNESLNYIIRMDPGVHTRLEEHTSELQSRENI